MEHGIFGWLAIIVGLIFILGGSRRLEDLGKGFGGFMREFNRAKKEAEEAPKKTIDEASSEKEAKPDEKKSS
jgi:Sec-independent protein translocase protein TatA